MWYAIHKETGRVIAKAWGLGLCSNKAYATGTPVEDYYFTKRA